MIDTILQRSRIVAGVALLVSVVLAFMNGAQFFRSYLLAYIFILGLSLGSFAILLIYHLSGGRWAAVIRRMLEASIRVIPFLAILFLPIILGMKQIYLWADDAKVAADHILQEKALYLNVPFFIGRAALYS